MNRIKIEKLPKLIERKIYKTGQTRGATNQEIYQNRVGRNSTVLIPFNDWNEVRNSPGGAQKYESGYIVLISPEWYFSRSSADQDLEEMELKLGNNALLYYQRREEWITYGPSRNKQPADSLELIVPNSRTSPLGGNYLARIHGTTAKIDGERIALGYAEGELRGAGIRAYEYASKETIEDTKIQLEAIFWTTRDSLQVVSKSGMSLIGAYKRQLHIIKEVKKRKLWDVDKLRESRIINYDDRAICPFCLKEISAEEFEKRGEQMSGRETWDITITEVSLFHIEELRPGLLQHRPYNLGWGHHYCNVVVKDAGIEKTLDWAYSVIETNLAAGWSPYSSKRIPSAGEQEPKLPENKE